MNRKVWIIVAILLAVMATDNGFCIDPEDVMTLKKAGVSDKTIRAIIKEKAIETCLVTIDEILALKQAGMSDQTIRTIIDEDSFMKDAGTVVYGKDIKSIRFTTVTDIIALKREGVSDETIRTIILSGSNKAGDSERERAWEMLENMGIVFDRREVAQ